MREVPSVTLRCAHYLRIPSSSLLFLLLAQSWAISSTVFLGSAPAISNVIAGEMQLLFNEAAIWEIIVGLFLSDKGQSRIPKLFTVLRCKLQSKEV